MRDLPMRKEKPFIMSIFIKHPLSCKHFLFSAVGSAGKRLSENERQDTSRRKEWVTERTEKKKEKRGKKKVTERGRKRITHYSSPMLGSTPGPVAGGSLQARGCLELASEPREVPSQREPTSLCQFSAAHTHSTPLHPLLGSHRHPWRSDVQCILFNCLSPCHQYEGIHAFTLSNYSSFAMTLCISFSIDRFTRELDYSISVIAFLTGFLF